jgi:hypothetical protein
MSQQAKIEELVRQAVQAQGHGGGHGGDSGEVTQLKKENTGLRNRVKALEDRVDTLEKAGKPVTATAGTASASGKAHNTK